MIENSENPLTLLSVVRQWPVARNIAEHLPAGSLINLARSSASLRSVLHGFDMSTTVERCVEADLQAHAAADDVIDEIHSRQVLHIGAHRTHYWEGLKRAAPFTCSSKTHTKGDKTRSCLFCSMPTCESCIVKHSFGKNESTFKNRCRFMCQRCWNIGNVQKERRYSGRSTATNKYSHKSAATDRQYCTCTSKDGWVCNDCKEKQNVEARVDGAKVCVGQGCGSTLEEDKYRRKICLWCDKPVPRGRASMESRIAFDQKLMDARERELNSQIADFEEYESNRRKQMRMSRRELRGDEAVRDDPDADVEQFVRNLDILNYQSLCGKQPSGDEIYGSKHGKWKYESNFLKRFMERCPTHKDAASLKSMTFLESPDVPSPKTNMDLWVMKARRLLDEEAEILGLTDNSDAASDTSFDFIADTTDVSQRTQEQTPDADDATSHRIEKATETEEVQEHDIESSLRQEDGIATAQKETQAHVRLDEATLEPGFADVQPGERPPEYGADTLILESGDAMESD